MFNTNQKDIILSIDDARILWPNFSGTKDQFKTDGKKGFNLLLDEEQAAQLKAQGWNVKDKLNKSTNGAYYILPVEVRFDKKPPNVVVISGKNRQILNESTIGCLDYAELSKVDMDITGHFWEMRTGGSGIKAYLKSMVAIAVPDRLADKYKLYQDPSECDYPVDPDPNY